MKIMDRNDKRTFLKPISRRIKNLGPSTLRRSAEAMLGSDTAVNGGTIDSIYDDDDDNLAPVMPAIDAVQQLMEEEDRAREAQERRSRARKLNEAHNVTSNLDKSSDEPVPGSSSSVRASTSRDMPEFKDRTHQKGNSMVEGTPKKVIDERNHRKPSLRDDLEDDESFIIRNNPLVNQLINPIQHKRQEEYEFIPKSVILDVYSNDPEVKRFLKHLPKIGNEFGYNEQDYKCYSCRRPIGMVFGQSRMCHFDGHHYCYECHLGEKSPIPARILCNWDFNKYPISKRNQHFLTLISNEPMFELKTMAPLLYKACPDLREIEELRCQAFFIRSYCFTCVQDSVSFELTKLVWPREHLIKQIDLYSLEDLIQIKSGALKQVLRNVIVFGRQHVLSCMLCCQKGFICELCKSSQIIYPFDTDSVYRCVKCQSIYHKACFKAKPSCDACPRCQRLRARRINP